MTRRNVGIGLVLSAVVLAVVAFLLWQAETDDAESEERAREFAEAISGQPFDDVEPNRAPAIALGAVSAVLFLGGVIVLAIPATPSRDS